MNRLLALCVLGLILHGTQVHAAKQQVPTPNPDPLEGLEPPTANVPPELTTLNLTQLAPLLPLLSQINASVVATWVPIIEVVEPGVLEAWAPALNQLSNTTVEAVIAALPSINVSTVLQLLPAINALPADTLEGYVKVLGQVDYKLVEALLPSIAVLDPTWVNKVVPALNAIDPDYLVAVIKAIAPELVKINPDQIVALIPAISTVSVSTWEKLIELLNSLTIDQLEFLVHLLDVTGPVLDNMVRMLNFFRRMMPIDVSTVQGRTTVYTKEPGSEGFSDDSKVIAQKSHPTSEPNNGAPPAPLAPDVPITPIPTTIPALHQNGNHRRSLLRFWN